MEFLAELWMPILVSAVCVFLVSSVLHMLLPIHKSDYGKLEREAELMASMREQGVQPGTYMFPNCDSMKDLESPEMVEKFKQGPVGWMTVMPSGPPSMGRPLLLWFLYTILLGVFLGYLSWMALEPGA